MKIRLSMTLLCVSFLCACGALPNPAPPTAPSAWQPEPVQESPQGTATPASPAPPPRGAGEAPSSPAEAPAAAASRAAPEAPVSEAPVVIATVGGRPVDIRELLAQWLHTSSPDVLEQLDRLVTDRLVLAEAGRLGLAIDPAAHDAAYKRAIAAIEAEIGRKRPGVTLDRYVDQVLSLDPLVYRERLRDDALRQLLAERVIRGFVLQSEHARVRVLLADSEEKVKEVQAGVAAGESFEELARRLSSHSSAKDGGRVAPVVRSNTAMGKLAFETAIGAVGGPIFEQGAWLFLQVEERPEPLAGSWTEIRAAVEASLAERGMQSPEIQQWQAAMYRRYEVDIRPLMRLAGEPAR